MVFLHIRKRQELLTFSLEDLLDMLTSQQEFDGSIEDLRKMEYPAELYNMVKQNVAVEFEVEIINPKHAYGTSIYKAKVSFDKYADKSEHNDQLFTRKWRKAI